MSDPIETSAAATPNLLRNFISFIGLLIATAAITSFGLLFLLEMTGANENPYSVLVTYILVPSILVFGLFVTFVGVLIERRRRLTRAPGEFGKYPILDLNDPRRRRSLVSFMLLGFVFICLTAFGSYRAFEYTESVSFCGIACHSVMKPEYTAYQASPHAKVTCVECHVGSGAGGYAQSKINGMRQLYGVVSGHYNRPVETPVRNMPATAETCQSCHWSEKYHGDEIKVFNHYGYDEKNSNNQTRLLIHVGGGDPKAGPVGGIHWHMNIANEITYIATDERRQVIPWVRMKDSSGKVVEFKTAGFTAQAETEKRTMNCIDCHNRPAHNYFSPNQAVDQSFDAGKLDTNLPFLKAKAVEALAKPYNTNDEAMEGIATMINDYYRASYPDLAVSRGDAISGAVTEVQRMYQTYFFPEMKTDWQAHPNNIGHYNAQGCFRCHDGQHFATDGRVIRNDCAVCHTTLDQTIAGKTVAAPGGMFQHPVNLGDRNTFQCASCHKGDRTFVHPLNLGDISQFQCAECHNGKTAPMSLDGIRAN
jgi:nitrate/TMAO reductase-like tetraheme cytochrome c subunit